MATIDDLTEGFVTTLAGILFPGTTYAPGATVNAVASWSSALGHAPLTIPTKLYRGAPEIAGLNADIAAGVSNVCVTSVPGMSRDTTRFQPYYSQISANVATLTVTWTSNSVTFGGTVSLGQAVGLTANKVAYAYRPLATDTLATIAAAFAAVVPGATATGPVLTVPSVTAAAVGVDQTVQYHAGQAQQLMCVAVLCPNITAGSTPASGYLVRAALGRLVDQAKNLLDANGNVTRFFPLPDGTTAKIVFAKQSDDDTPRNNNIWRRWVYFLCDYEETINITQSAALAINSDLSANNGPIIWLGVTPGV